MAYQQITLAQIRARLQQRLGAAAVTPTFWRSTELNTYINEALCFWNMLTGYWHLRAITITTVANQVWYTTPSALTCNMRVGYFSSVGTPNGRATVDLADLDAMDMFVPSWEAAVTDTSGTPGAIGQVLNWMPAGINLIAIYPADSANGNTIYVDGLADTPVLVSDGDYLDIGLEEIETLLDYMEHIALFKEGGAEFERSMTLFQGFLKSAGQRNELLNANWKFRVWQGQDINQFRQPQRDRNATPKLGIL